MSEPTSYLIDDALWEELIALTGGAAALCYQCGVCTATCPWGLVRGEALSVRILMRQAQLGLQDGSHNLWLCTTCAQCEAYCPRGVRISDVFRGLRAVAWDRRSVEAGLPSMLWSVHWNENPWSQPPSQRSDWNTSLDIPTFNSQQHEVLLYVGCTASFDRRAQKITHALVRVLRAAGVSFGYLGQTEPCCGEAVLSVGHKPYFREIALRTAQVFTQQGVSQLVAISPHCYDVFKNHYPPLAGDDFPHALHYTQFIAQLLDQGRLEMNTGLADLFSSSNNNHTLRVTFQDPCYLGRHNDEYDAPRRILEAVPGIELVEMKDTGLDSLCCGGGGGRMWLETAPGERFADLRVSQAVATEAAVLGTACPFCVVCLEDSAKQLKTKSLQVLDLAEIVALSLS
jgi:Fe-S oxidoreductase